MTQDKGSEPGGGPDGHDAVLDGPVESPRTKSEIAVRFGKNLADARRRSRLSQEALAVGASLHRTEIGLLERGERLPRIDTVVKLAGAMQIPTTDLIAGIEWQPGTTQAGAFMPMTDDKEGGLDERQG